MKLLKSGKMEYEPLLISDVMSNLQQRPDFASLIGDLQERLDVAADPSAKAWFENYLKHAVRYRGVKTPAVARLVTEWRRAHGLGQLSNEAQLALASSLIRQNHAEDKFAGTLYIQKYLLRRVDADALLTTSEELFSSGAFFDWSTTDWFSVRVLGPAIVRHGRDAARRIAAWRDAKDMWQRRASIVPFRAVVRDEAYHPLIESTVTVLVKEKARFIQTGIGWVISDLSKIFPRLAEVIVDRHFDDLSPEVIRRHTKRLPRHRAYGERKRARQ